jgi:hypothetical protein
MSQKKLSPSHSSLATRHCLVKIHQFDRRHRGLESLVAQLDSRAIDRLLERIRRYYSVDNRDASLHAGLRDPFSDFAGDVFKVRRLATNDRAETNHRVILLGTRQLECQQGNLERARNLVKLHRLFVSAQTFERIERAFRQPRSDEIIPAAGNQRKAKTLGVQASLMDLRLQASSTAPSQGSKLRPLQYR